MGRWGLQAPVSVLGLHLDSVTALGSRVIPKFMCTQNL